LLIYIVDNRHLFITNQEINHVNTTSNLKIRIPSADLTEFQKGLYYSGIKLLNQLPSHISLSDDTKLLRTILKSFFIPRSTYVHSIEEYCEFRSDSYPVE
jgi:hypothetical protein